MEVGAALLRALLYLMSLHQLATVSGLGTWRTNYHPGEGASSSRGAGGGGDHGGGRWGVGGGGDSGTFGVRDRDGRKATSAGELIGGGREQFHSISLPGASQAAPPHPDHAHPVRHYTKPESSRRYQGALLTKRDLDTSSSSGSSPSSSPLSGSGRMVHNDQSKSLQDLARADSVSAVLQHIEMVQNQRNCSGNTPLLKDYELLNDSYERFTQQENSTIKLANVLNNLFRIWDTSSASKTLYNEDFYYSLVRAMVENDEKIFGCAIAFDKAQYKSRDFCPYMYKDKVTGQVHVKDMATATRGRCAANDTQGYEWFVKLRSRNFSKILWDHQKSCTDLKTKSPGERAKASLFMSTRHEGMWTRPFFDCAGSKSWMVTYSVPFFGCNSNDNLQFKGAVAVDIDLARVDINQCATDKSFFANTHRCRPTTECKNVSDQGFRRGSYKCVCAKGYFFPPYERTKNHAGYYNGTDVERSYLNQLQNLSSDYRDRYTCLPCSEGCPECSSAEPCFVQYDVLIRGVPLGIQTFSMTITLVLGLVIMKIRKSKHHMGREVMKASMWVMLETVLLGALMSYATVIIQYFEPSTLTCLLMPWFREVGFAVIYGALILKVYRVLAEFQSRKAHRVHVRDRDLLKYLLGIVLVVIGYMSAWTAVNMDHVHDGDTMIAIGNARVGEKSFLQYHICKSFWWDYVIEVGEFLFLCFGVYLCYCVRAAPSDYSETRYISWAIYNETVISALLHIIRHFIWMTVHPDYIFLMYFLRCQLTVTMTLILVLGPKLWYAHRPPEDDHFRNRAYSSSDVHDTILPESMKLHVGVSSNGDVDVGEINLAEMDPEDIRAELKRLYTQLQIYKTKTMRKDNPHIPKRRGGRKQTHRRFSLQAFHYKHRHHHDHDHDHELSKTPEESTNSAEGVAIQMEPSSCGGEERTPTVTFKPGHKSFS